MSPFHGFVEVRRNDDGTIDEIVMTDAFGRCLVHLEQMDKGSWYLAMYVPIGFGDIASAVPSPNAQEEAFDVFRTGKKRVRVVQR